MGKIKTQVIHGDETIVHSVIKQLVEEFMCNIHHITVTSWRDFNEKKLIPNSTLIVYNEPD